MSLDEWPTTGPPISPNLEDALVDSCFNFEDDLSCLFGVLGYTFSRISGFSAIFDRTS